MGKSEQSPEELQAGQMLPSACQGSPLGKLGPISQDVPKGTLNTVRPNLNFTNCFGSDEHTNDTHSLAYSSAIFVWVTKWSPMSKLDSYYRYVCRAMSLAGRKWGSRGLAGISSVLSSKILLLFVFKKMGKKPGSQEWWQRSGKLK